MAIYLTHKYGTRFYGPEPDLPAFDPDKFIAFSANYQAVHVTWDPPIGSFDEFRLVRNRYGYPVTETDGDVLLSAQSPDIGYNDTEVESGKFIYYGIFLKISGVWAMMGEASCLHIQDYLSTDWLWDRLPTHYKILRGNRLDLEADENETLLRYVAMIGWGVDHVRTSITAAANSQDPNLSHIDTIDLLIQQYGLPEYPGMSGARKRAFVRDAASLLSRSGTEAELIAGARAASGWDLTLVPSPNLILTADQSTMTHPQQREWDPTLAYAVGNRVRLAGGEYVCLAAATGYDQMPAGDRTSNTWWAPLLVRSDADVAYDSASVSQHGWQGQVFTVGVADIKAVTGLVLGAPKPGDPTQSINAVVVTNNHTTTANIGARLLPEAAGAAVQPMTPITNGIPLPEASDWESARSYPPGSVVLYRGRLYQAIRPGRLGFAPEGSDRWQVVGTDSRLRLTVSAYTHQPHTATGQPVAPAQMFMDWFDDRGKLISREFGAATDTRVLDTYTSYTTSTEALNGRVTEYGTKTWVDQVSAFRRSSYQYGVVAPQTSGTRALSTVNYGTANAAVAATFVTGAPAGQVQALILRYTSTTTYVRATRTALQTVNGASVTTLATYATPVADRDRLMVRVTGDSYTVFRNGSQVATATSTFNNTATIFGLAVEA